MHKHDAVSAKGRLWLIEEYGEKCAQRCNMNQGILKFKTENFERFQTSSFQETIRTSHEEQWYRLKYIHCHNLSGCLGELSFPSPGALEVNLLF